MANTEILKNNAKNRAKGCAWFLVLVIGVFGFLFYRKVSNYNTSPTRLTPYDLIEISDYSYNTKSFLEQKIEMNLTVKGEGDTTYLIRENSVIFTYIKNRKGCTIYLFKENTYNKFKDYIENYTAKKDSVFILNKSKYLRFYDFDQRKKAYAFEIFVNDKPKEEKKGKDF